MATVDSNISSLPAATTIDDNSLLVVEQQGEARKVAGSVWKSYATAAVSQYVDDAQGYADAAAQSASSAASSLEAISGSVEQAAESATEASESATDANGYADNASTSATQASGSATSAEQHKNAALTAASDAQSARDDAEAAQTAAESARDVANSAKTAAETAKGEAETAASTAEGYATAAGNSASAASDSATAAEESENAAAESASEASQYASNAQDAQQAIENMTVQAETLDTGEDATVNKSIVQGVVNLLLGLPRGATGAKGDPGNNIQSIVRTEGTGAAGTTDTYTVYLTDGSVGGTFQVYNGADGIGSGDMLKSIYDPQNKNTDVFSYIDSAIDALRSEIMNTFANVFIVQPEGE